MSRPLRLEYEGALYHVTSRGNERKATFLEDSDFSLFLEVLGEVCEQCNWVIHSWCLMTNHYHLVVETPDANLSAGMRQLNGIYTIRFNHQYGRVGHLFQGRYKGILVDKSAYLLELSRYVVLNPVRARMVSHPGLWPWSSYNSTLGLKPSPSWLATDAMLLQFSHEREQACLRFQQFVAEGVGKPLWNHLRQQVFLGDERFVEQQLTLAEKTGAKLSQVPHRQKRNPARPLSCYQDEAASRNDAICNAWQSGGYTMQAIADYFGVHSSTVSRVVARHKI
ncbi:transposase [Sansalvadorimonas sp. 2012CJ34-2]|uniref:Transposase n=1 Tax=Parendozoicomonas callyspongiae TaxID=2942213 RepID=A0ABT0PHE8_9GAMM|nr:transposase [Sansalvadorimonas sp. 2012CJ34-2]MCL6270758.1 transposase [Sansalvadorimonas sp. 2012CJ34-2]